MDVYHLYDGSLNIKNSLRLMNSFMEYEPRLGAVIRWERALSTNPRLFLFELNLYLKGSGMLRTSI